MLNPEQQLTLFLFDDGNEATIPIHPNLLPLLDAHGRSGANHGGNPKVARDDRAVRERATFFDNETLRVDKKCRPTGIGRRTDQDVTCADVAGIGVDRTQWPPVQWKCPTQSHPLDFRGGFEFFRNAKHVQFLGANHVRKMQAPGRLPAKVFVAGSFATAFPDSPQTSPAPRDGGRKYRDRDSSAGRGQERPDGSTS